MKVLHIQSLMLATLLGLHAAAQAAEPLRIGVTDADAAPIVVLSSTRSGQLVGGLSKELGDAMANRLGTRADYQIIARNRIEPSLEKGKVDIVCNANRAWYGNADKLGWTRELYPQIERVIGPRMGVAAIANVSQLAGKRIGVIQGYHYASLDPLWDKKESERVDQARLESLMRALTRGLVDVAVSSELELAAWAKANRSAAHVLQMHPIQISRLPTMCAVSPQGSYSVEQLDKAITQLEKDGTLQGILTNYAWKQY